MTSSGKIHVRAGYKWIVTLLFVFAISLLNATEARAQSDGCVSTYGGLIDGNINPVSPAHIQIDGNCTIRNFPASNPFTSNVSFYGNNPTSWLVIFDNVNFTGNMSCNLNSQGNFLWFTNGSTSTLKQDCLNLLVDVEKINKQNPPGQTTAAIGVPFTYKMTIPVLFDPASGTVINSNGSPNDLHDITITDDLNATGADMSFVSERAYWLSNGTPIPHTFSNAGGVLNFAGFPTVVAGQQFVIEVTVVLRDTPSNVPGKQFVNTAKWQFGRLIGGVFTEPLPGQWGITPPMTIVGPAVTLTKSGPTTMNLGQPGNFALDIKNTGNSDAWNVSLRDVLPHGATGGMCDQAPAILSAQVFAADGATPVPGKGPLNQGSDYSLSYSAAPNCQLDITMLTAAGRIGPNERLIIRYRTQLDANTQSGVALTNVAGAIQWFNGDSSVGSRKSYTGPLTNGTPGILDNQDAFTVTVTLSGYLFEKTVADLTSGANPATTAAPGDKLRYTLRFRTSQALNNFRIFDELDALNAQADFAPGTLALVTSPAGADTSATSSTGGSKGTGVIDVRNLNVAANGEVQIQFDITLKPVIANGTVVTNQSTLRLSDGTTFALSDDPSVNGAASPTVSGDEDPTRVTIVSASNPALVVTKSGPATMNLGQWGDFALDVQNTGTGDAWNVSFRDLLPHSATGGMCDMTPEILSAQVFAADGVTPLTGKGPLNPGADYSFSYSAAPNCTLEITMLTGAGRIGPSERLVIRYRTQLDANTQNGVTLTNVAGAVQWFDGDSSNTNRASFIRTLTNGTPGIPDHEDAHSVMVTLTGYFFDKTVADLTSGVNPAKTAAPGDRLRYTLRFRATNQALSNFRIYDEMDALNAQAAFVPGTLTLVTYPAGADISATSSTGGSKGTGVIHVRNLSLPANGEVLIQFDITLIPNIVNGTVVANQSTLGPIETINFPYVVPVPGTTTLLSDDPNVNGSADPTVAGDEDPTRVTIASAPAAFRVQKISTDLTGDPNVLLAGETLRYTITVKNIGNTDAANVMLRDAVPANTSYVAGSATLNGAAVADIAGVSPLVNGLRINSPANTTPGAMPADASSSPANVATIKFDVVVNPSVASGTVISNQGFVTATDSNIVDQPSDDPDTPAPNDPTLDIVGNSPEPALMVTKSGPATAMNLGQWGDFAINVQNTGLSDAWDVTLRDLLPHGATGGMCDLTPEILSAQIFAADGITPIAGKGPLTAGSGYALSYSAAPNCQLDITMLTAAGRIGPNERLIVRYRTQLDANTQNGVTLTNIAGAIQWFNADSSNTNRKSYPHTLTNGTPGVLDHEDAFTVNTALSGYFFEKTVANVTSGANPATTAAPGDKLRYTLRFRTTNQALSNFRILDELDALNAQADFAPGTLTIVASPSGADISATSSTGGAKGTGVIDIRNLNLPVSGEALIQFDITLKPAIANGTIVSNQSSLRLADGTSFALSDDPNVNGTASPTVSGDEDPTRLKIVSAAGFRVQKISSDLSGDPNVLLAGETLRYTITVKNVSSADAVNVTLRDAVPANTTYVAGSTKLNGAVVADVAGLSPLVNGMPINSPANTTPGSMPADASSSPANVATITFDVVVNANVANGTVISNQGFVTATDSGIVDQPSDDPRTPAPNDPTMDIVGNRPSLYAEKRVVLFSDSGSPGIVDPGDVLRYTITVKNSAAIPATGVVLTDSVPANTTYVANSTLLNGLTVGQPDGGVSPLASGINISSSNLTPPLPGPGAGTISPDATAVLQYDLLVNAGTPAGTVISNQAVVSSTGLPNLLTDGDGNPATGPEPTVVVVGAGQQLSISNQVTVVGGGAAVPGAQLDYVITVVNNAAVPALNVVITDDLNATQAGQLAYVNLSATMNGATTGVGFAGSTITANYAAANGTLAPGASVVLRFRATLNPNLVLGTVVTNTGVVAWNNPTQTASASVSIVVGSMPGFAVMNGSAWHDANFNDVRDSGERALAGWTVELYRDNQLSQSVLTDASGAYRMIGVEPNDTTAVRYELRFHAPGAGANTAMLGRAVSPFTNGMQRISDIVVRSGANLQDLNLAIHPNGVVYNSEMRTPVAGATLNLLDARSSSALPASCFDDAAQQGQITLADGYYKFDINFSNAACPSGGDYLISVTPPQGSSYVAGDSQVIPPKSSASTAAFSVPACPSSAADAIPVTAQFCEAQPSEFPPAPSVPARGAGTNYYVHLILDGTQTPGSSQIFNNHIALDPQTTNSFSISKSTPLLNVTRGQLVPYVITVNNIAGLNLTDVSITDRPPAGFTYVQGSALLDGVPTEPSVVGRALVWNGVAIADTKAHTLRLLFAVGAGVSEGEYVNRAQVVNGVSGGAMSGEASASVRLMPDPTFDCTDVIGKVFNDANRNGRQDEDEGGLPGVRVVTARGLQATTDQYGRYHITCAITPNEDRGSNFVLKLDDRTLPSGFRMSTDAVQIKRATRGETLRLNFGASIFRVVGIDLSDAVFESGKTEIRVQWRPRLNLLLEELRKAPAVLRLSYVADTEDSALVERRMEAVKRQLTEAWSAANSYVLSIEPEVFWRRGAPPKRLDERVRGSR